MKDAGFLIGTVLCWQSWYSIHVLLGWSSKDGIDRYSLVVSAPELEGLTPHVGLVFEL